MRVDHITFSKSGGAGLVAAQLQSKQLSAGVDSLLFTSLDTDLFREPLREPRITAGALIDRTAVSSQVHPTMISLFRPSVAREEKRVRDGSIIHLHWVEGVLRRKQIEQWLDEGRKIVWTLHDMAPFTGACHHSFDCYGFQGGCQNCPQVRLPFRNKVALNLQSKILRQTHENLRVVAPTKWLAERARSSSVFRDQEISVIPNPISEVYFQRFNREKNRSRLGIKQNAIVGVVIANNLLDPNKRVAEVVELFNRVSSRHSGLPLQLILVGNQGDKFKASPTAVVSWLGALSPSALAETASAADFVVSFSQAESAGMTIRECGALGLPALASSGGGAIEMFIPNSSGFLVESANDLELLLARAVAGEVNLELAGTRARVESMINHPDTVMAQYQTLYESFT